MNAERCAGGMPEVVAAVRRDALLIREIGVCEGRKEWGNEGVFGATRRDCCMTCDYSH